MPEGADLCIVDERGLEDRRAALAEWKATQAPAFAPVLLLAADEGHDAWDRYAGEPRYEPIDVAEAVELVAADVAAAHPAADIRLALPDEAVAVATNDFEKALRELLVNAIEHAGEPGPVVRASVRAADARIEVEVADEGPGIPAVERRVVTGEQSPEPLYHGSGLGLWLVALIVRRSNGTLQFADWEPRGTVVTVRLPAADR